MTFLSFSQQKKQKILRASPSELLSIISEANKTTKTDKDKNVTKG